MRHTKIICGLSVLAALSTRADLNPLGIFNGNVGLSIDAMGSNEPDGGIISAHIPVGATVLAAYLYSAGTPYPYYPNHGGLASPQSIADYNSSAITLEGNTITFSSLVGASSDNAGIGKWFTARADVTGLVNSLRQSGTSDYDWRVTEGNLNTRIDGELLAIVYEHPSLPEASVVLLDGGQKTTGETTSINFSAPLSGASSPEFFADLSLGISFSTGLLNQQSKVLKGNGQVLTSAAGGYDDGFQQDGALITAGGIGDSNDDPSDPLSTNTDLDDELYSLKGLLADGDTSLQIYSQNPSDNDNLFFLGLRIAAPVANVQPLSAPDLGNTLSLFALGLTALTSYKLARRDGKESARSVQRWGDRDYHHHHGAGVEGAARA